MYRRLEELCAGEICVPGKSVIQNGGCNDDIKSDIAKDHLTVYSGVDRRNNHGISASYCDNLLPVFRVLCCFHPINQISALNLHQMRQMGQIYELNGLTLYVALLCLQRCQAYRYISSL